MITHVFNSSVVSGPETLVLPALRKLNFPVTIIFLSESRLPEASKGPIEYAKRLGHEVYSVQVRGRWDPKAFLELRNLIDQIRPEILHAHDVKASLYVQQAQKAKPQNLLYKKAFLVSTHHGASYRRGKIRLYEELYVRYVLPDFDLVLAVCEADRESMIKRGIPSSKIEIHLNGTDRPQIPLKLRADIGHAIRKSWKKLLPGLPEESELAQTIFLGAVARLSPEKRHDRMILVLKKILELRPTKNIILLCFGIGAEEQKLKELVRKHGLSKNVFFAGYSTTISKELAGFDLVMCLSDGEGIPINLLEAAWAATPVFATKVGGIPDLIPSEEFGYLVNKEDSNELIAQKLLEAIENPEQRHSIGANFQNRVVAYFSEEAWLKRLVSVYARSPSWLGARSIL